VAGVPSVFDRLAMPPSFAVCTTALPRTKHLREMIAEPFARDQHGRKVRWLIA
jgi:hypothetical protein